MNLVKAKQRVANHDEVCTPAWMVEDMLAGMKEETERVDPRLLASAWDSGNFIGQTLRRGLVAVDVNCSKLTSSRWLATKRHSTLRVPLISVCPTCRWINGTVPMNKPAGAKP